MLALDTLFYGTDALPSDLVTAGTFSILKGLRSSPANIFLLKVDAEGYDYDILDGASTLLAAHRVKFLSFEYNDKWFTNGRTRTLKDVTTQLHDKFGYQCHWITPAQLIPLSGVWWSEEYECRMWSNVFCGVKGDEDLDVVRDVYARMGGRYSGK